MSIKIQLRSLNELSVSTLNEYFNKKKNGDSKKWGFLLLKITKQKGNTISNKINKIFSSIFKK